MSESSQPVRIVYHAGNRTFARLFNERSLEEVKDVVRRKLGLGRETDVSLRQMIGSDALLDLEDDDDFQAFRVLLRSTVSVDIQVTVGRSQGSTVPPVSPKPREKLSASEPTTASPSRKPAGVAESGHPIAHLEVSHTAEASTTIAKTPQPSARKRRVSFGDTALAGSDKPAERHAVTKSITVTPVASAKTAESPATPKLADAEGPPKKKQKKESTKKKDVQTTEAIESLATKASDAPKPKPKKSTALGRVSKAAPKDVETSESLAKKQKKQKMDDIASRKKSFISDDPYGIGRLVSQPTGSSAEDGASNTLESEKPIGVCASMPQTSASISVQSEVAAAILSGYLSKASETIPPKPPAKRKYVKRDTKKSSASSSALPAEPTTVLDASANEPPNQTLDPNGPPCPICLEEPFHIRYCCPTVLKGPGAIRERLGELKRTSMGDQQSLIKQLEGLLHDLKVTSKPSLDVAPTDGIQSRKASPPPNASLPRTPNIPSNSYLSEVTVESRDEGSSSESSDDMSEGGVKQQGLPALRRQKTPDEQPSLSNDDLEAVIRGPASKRQSILCLLDLIVEDKDVEVSDSEEDEAELEEDPDEETGRSRRRSSRHITRSSDSESEEEGSRSPSPSRSSADTSNNLGPGVQGSNEPVEKPTEHQDGDVVMRDSVNPSVLEGQDADGSEDSHVGSEDRLVVDESIGEKGAVVVEEQPSSPAPGASVLAPSDALNNKPQESGKTEVDAAPNRAGSVPVASEVLKEVEADPIEPADDLESPIVSRSLNADPIEAPSEDIGSFFATMTQLTPKPGVSKRIKTRNGQIPDDEADRPVLLEQLDAEVMDEVTPIPAKGRSRRKVTETPASQEPAPTRKSPRFSSLPPSTSTPAAAVLLNRAKVGARAGKSAKTPAKQSEDAPQSIAKDNTAQNGRRIAPTPSLLRWETFAEPSSPSLQSCEPSVRIDELMSSSPQPDDNPIRGRLNEKEKKGRPRKPASSRQAESSQAKQRLFDLSSSQIPFPYSQNQINPAPTAFPNGNESEGMTDSEEEPKVVKKKAKLPAVYRSLSQLASQAPLFSPSLPTPASKSVTNGKAKKCPADEDSSSSSSSDADEANGSGHIPRERRAGSVLETAKKRRSTLSRI